MVFSPRRRVLRPCNCHESAGVPFYRTGFHVAIRGVNSFQCRYAWEHAEVPMRFSIVAPTTWRCAFENDGRQKGRLLRPHSEMIAITQRNLVFAHVLSMRPIEILDARPVTPKRPIWACGRGDSMVWRGALAEHSRRSSAETASGAILARGPVRKLAVNSALRIGRDLSRYSVMCSPGGRSYPLSRVVER